MAMTEYVVEKENHHSGAEIIRVNSDKLFELSGNPHVKRINVLEKWENGKLIQQNYDSTKFEISKKGLKAIVVETIEGDDDDK